MFMYEFLTTSMHVWYMYACYSWISESAKPPGTGVMNDCEPPREPNPDLLCTQQVLITTESSLWA